MPDIVDDLQSVADAAMTAGLRPRGNSAWPERIEAVCTDAIKAIVIRTMERESARKREQMLAIERDVARALLHRWVAGDDLCTDAHNMIDRTRLAFDTRQALGLKDDWWGERDA